MNSGMRVFIVSLLFITLAGCVSAPYRDDYTAHINEIPHNYDEQDLQFVLVSGATPDIRGIYSNDDTTSPSPILYQGVGGLAGAIAQIGAHASMINSQRNTKLAEAQSRANSEIEPLINAAKEINLFELLTPKVQSPDEKPTAPNLVQAKPVFFASSSMDKVSLHLIVWIDSKGRSRGEQPEYQNLIQVFSKRLSPHQRDVLSKGDKQLLSNIMKSLLNASLFIAKSDLIGKYATKNPPNKTHLVDKHSGEKVVRGAVIDKTCEYIVIRDIHSWFIAHSVETSETHTDQLVGTCSSDSLVSSARL